MKKFFVVLVVVALMMAFATSAFAAGHGNGHPNVDPDKAGRANANAADGLHRAAANVEYANGRAAHVLLYWVGPHGAAH